MQELRRLPASDCPMQKINRRAARMAVCFVQGLVSTGTERKKVVSTSGKVYSLDEIRHIATPIAARHGVAALYLFGSYARGEATPESDLDLRIEKGRIQSLFQLTGFEMDMEEGFDKPLDVLTTPMLSEQFLRSIQPEEVLIYAEN